MIKYILLLLVFYLSLLSCGNFNLLNGPNPKKKSFTYYNKNLKFLSSSRLQLNRKYYFRYSDTSVNILVFFEDGFLNKYYTKDTGSVSTIRSESGVIMGYYTTRQDSIFFTTKSYYQKRSTVYWGLIENNAIDLKIKSPNSRDTIRERYLLQ